MRGEHKFARLAQRFAFMRCMIRLSFIAPKNEVNATVAFETSIWRMTMADLSLPDLIQRGAKIAPRLRFAVL